MADPNLLPAPDPNLTAAAPLGTLPPPPTPTNLPGGILGALIGFPAALGSAAQAAIATNQAETYQRQIAMARAQAQMAGMIRYRSDLDPKERDLFDASPFDYVDQQVKNRQLTKLAGGESAVAPGSDMITAPLVKVDDPSGLGVSLTPQGMTVLGPPLPGQFSADHGIILNSRSGVAGTYTEPQHFPSDETLTNVSPTVIGGVAGTQQPFIGPPGGQPPPQAQTGAQPPTAAQGVDQPQSFGQPQAGPASLRHLSATQQGFAGRILGNSAVQKLSPDDQRTLVGISYAESQLGSDKDSAGHAATGLFQMQPQWFPGVNLADPDQQATAAAGVLQQGRTTLTKALGRPPTPSEIYLSFMQGPTGSSALLSAPAGETAVNALMKAGVNPRRALQSITGNGGAANMSASDFVNMWNQRFQGSMNHVWGAPAQAQAATQAGAPAAADGRSTWETQGPAPQPGQPMAAPVSAQAQGVNAAAVGGPQAPPPVTFQGSSQVVIPGKTTQDVPSREATGLGAGPGLYQRTPKGELVLKSAPPKADMERIASLQATVDAQRQLAVEQDDFVRHNNGTNTGWVLGSPTIPHVGTVENPLATWGESHNRGIQGMEASHGKQVLMVKPDNAGARILQSELPFWEPQTQDVGKTLDVNSGIAQETHIRADRALTKLNFFSTWLQNRGNLFGADQAFDTWMKSRDAQRSQHPQQGPAQGAAANDPLGIRN